MYMTMMLFLLFVDHFLKNENFVITCWNLTVMGGARASTRNYCRDGKELPCPYIIGAGTGVVVVVVVVIVVVGIG